MISHKQFRIDGFILRFSVVAMAYCNQADSTMTSCSLVLDRRYTMRPPQHLVYGAISGAPFNSSYLLTTLASNMWEKNMPYISSRLQSRTTRSPQTGKEQNLQESNLHGVTISGTPIRPAASPWMGILQECSSSMDTPPPENHNSHHTNIVR